MAATKAGKKAVPPAWEQRIAASSLLDAERWGEDLFDGATPEALFGRP